MKALAAPRYWREGDLRMSPSDGQLALLPRSSGAAWRPLAGLVDADAIRSLATLLAPTTLLRPGQLTVPTDSGSFTVKSCIAITGAHAFSGRLVTYPRTIELREHVNVRGPAARLDSAVHAFAEHVCSSALEVHSLKEHFVLELEVYTGEGDAFDDEATAEVPDGRSTSNARGAPERFGVGELHTRPPSMVRALHAAIISQMPIYLQLIVCVPVVGQDHAAAAGLLSGGSGGSGGGGISGAAGAAAGGAGTTGEEATEDEPPRWHFMAVQKRLCFYYDATVPLMRSSKGRSGGGAADAAGGGAGGASSDGSSSSSTEQSPGGRLQPILLQSLFQCVWLGGDTDALWYRDLRENKLDAAAGGGFGDARNQFMAFMRSQACHYLMRGDHFTLLEALLFLGPEVEREEREPLLAEIHGVFRSDAAMLKEISHQYVPTLLPLQLHARSALPHLFPPYCELL